MPVPATFYDTGFAVLPDLATLSYNGVRFSSLFKTRMSGAATPDTAKRAIKYVKYTLYVEGVAGGDLAGGGGIVGGGVGAILGLNNIMNGLRAKLEAPAGALQYTNKGFGVFAINTTATGQKDVAWGPIPKVLEFSPLGGNNAAYVRWQVEVTLPEIKYTTGSTGGLGTVGNGPVLEFTWEYHVRYDARGYSSLRVNGTLEIPITRTSATARAVLFTVDEFRQKWMSVPIDLTKFKVVDRAFDVSRDRRTATFNYQADELPPMGIPPGCTAARGTCSARNVGSLTGQAGSGGIAMIMWQISLRCTYTVRGDQDQRVAEHAFLSLLWYRMQQSRFASVARLSDASIAGQQGAPNVASARQFDAQAAATIAGLNAAGIPEQQADDAVGLWQTILSAARIPATPNNAGGAILLLDFGVDEGLYEDSDTMSFHAAWSVATNLQSLLFATGFNRWLPGTAGRQDNLWAQSVKSCMGWTSWLDNVLNSANDIVVDVGFSGAPWGG